MQKIFPIVKEILEAQDTIKFTVDEEKLTFTCNQFDVPIILDVGRNYTYDARIEAAGPAHIHRFERNYIIYPHMIKYIHIILEHMFENLFTPVFRYELRQSENPKKFGIEIQETDGGYDYRVVCDNGVYTKYHDRWCEVPFVEKCDSFDLDFTNLKEKVVKYYP